MADNEYENIGEKSFLFGPFENKPPPAKLHAFTAQVQLFCLGEGNTESLEQNAAYRG